ncbi:class I SAM-dependent methyltransferase [Dehalococcoidia bacterium]|nr:class I SAM-dependent methyltransferase [Dehalococcoidia bacterium]
MVNKHRSQLQSFWDERSGKELRREKEDPRKQVHTGVLWREIKRCIQKKPSLTILDAGAGFGRFSIPLAKVGHKVVHLDISPKMLEIAHKKAYFCGITTIEFVQGSIDDLSGFGDNDFDLVLCLDSPLSSCYNTYETALSGLIRVTGSRLVLCVMNRSGVISEGGVDFDLKHFGKLKTVLEVHNTGTLLVTEELKSLQPTLFPSWYAFTPSEIKELLERKGCRVEKISAPGTLTRFVDPELLKRLINDKEAYESYLDFEERYDSDMNVLGIGAIGAGGLLVTAQKVASK